MRQPPAGAERRAVPFRKLAWVLLGCTALIAAGAGLAYERLLYYPRSAALHLPEGVEFAARLDVEKVVLFEPVRRHLLPLLERLPLGAAAAAPTERLARLRREAGLNLGLDLREILVASAQQGRAWVVVLGGTFPATGLVPALERLLRSEGASGWSSVGESLEFAPSGAALGQAGDGVLVLASDPGTLRSCLPSTRRFEELRLARKGAGGAEITGTALVRWLAPLGLPWSGSFEHAGVSLRLVGEGVAADTRITLADPGGAEALAALARRWLQRGTGPLDPWTGSPVPWALLGRTNSVEIAEKTVEISSSIQPAELDRALRDLAAWVQRRL